MTVRAARAGTSHRVAGLIAAGLFALALPSCAGGGDKDAAAPTSGDRTTQGTDEAATTTTEVPTDPVTDAGGAAGSPVDPCAGFDAEQISALVGFPVEGDGVSTDNGLGFLSCSFRAPLDESEAAGATVTIGAQRSSESSESIEDALAQMGAEDARVVPVEVGDGGWLLLGDGFAELRARIGGVQLDVSLITPLGESTDLAKPTIDVATAVAARIMP